MKIPESPNTFSFENQILFHLDREIISSIDEETEYRYLTALNKNLRYLNDDQIFELSKKSSLREKIKKIAILNNFKDPKI